LVGYGFVDQPFPRKGYILGPMAYYVARRGIYRKDIVAVAEPLMEALARRTGETVLLAALRRDCRVLLAVVEGNQEVQVRPPGSLLDDVYITATGRLLLAHLPEREREAFIKKRGLPGPTWPEASTSDRLDRLLAEARRAGFIVLRARQHVQVAFPVFESGQVVAALGLPVPVFRFTRAAEPGLLAAARKTAAAISAKLPYHRAEARQEASGVQGSAI
jgi:DNA-binding IclR family transcriptional regulator